jgi:hypothetical protein
VDACTAVLFYAYTPSRRVPAMKIALEALAGLPNFRMCFSADKDTGLPDRLPAGVRIAWLREDHDAPVPADADLVFRIHKLRRRPARQVNLMQVCPVENGVTGHKTSFIVSPADRSGVREARGLTTLTRLT